MDGPVVVELKATQDNTTRIGTSQGSSATTFEGLGPGEYEAEAECPGYQTTTERINVIGFGSTMQVYIYLSRDSEGKPASKQPQGLVMSPKLQAEIDKGIEALHSRHFEVARAHFAKGAQLAPGNPDVAYLLGVAELGLNHTDRARQSFEHAVSLDPGNERALLSLGELQLNADETSLAIATLEKAYQINGAGWRTQFLLATAYAKSGRLEDAESHAQRAIILAGNQGAVVRVLLGEIQAREKNLQAARQTWQDVVTAFPDDPAAEQARQHLAALSASRLASPSPELVSFPVHALPNLDLAPPKDQPWAPLDIDSRDYPPIDNAACDLDAILPSAERHLQSQLENFEKFTATEHIEHQEIDRYGRPGPVRSRDFSYIVFVYPFQGDSFYLDEKRISSHSDDSFPTSLATIGLNNLGVAVLQPAARDEFSYRCEGLMRIRGQAAWQVRFEEKKESREGIREWQRNGRTYHIPLKGRLWIASASFDVLRIETDLREPVPPLELTRDHLIVDYGPVSFVSHNTSLWLPWSAEMFMELHGHRYHHKHYLTDYMLFEVDTNHKVGKPKDQPPPAQLMPSAATGE